MKQIILTFFFLSNMISCKNSVKTYEAEAQQKTTQILNKAKLKVIKEVQNYKIHKMPEMDSIIERTAQLLYDADAADFLTEDCMTKPSTVAGDSGKIENAMRDSIYRIKLIVELNKLRDTKRLNHFNKQDFLIHQEQLLEISSELRSFCAEDVIENLRQMSKAKF